MMKRKTTQREQLQVAIDEARRKGAEFVCYAGRNDAVRVEDAIETIRRLPEDLGDEADELARWYECDTTGRKIIRAREIFGGLTRHQSGVIVWSGSAEIFCGNWIDTRGMPRSFGPPDISGEGKKLVAVCLEPQQLDDDTLELAFKAADARGDRSPSISEVFRVNDLATIITFDGWP